MTLPFFREHLQDEVRKIQKDAQLQGGFLKGVDLRKELSIRYRLNDREATAEQIDQLPATQIESTGHGFTKFHNGKVALEYRVRTR